VALERAGEARTHRYRVPSLTDARPGRRLEVEAAWDALAETVQADRRHHA